MTKAEVRATRRRDFVKDDLAAYWPTYVAGACFLIAFLYAVFVLHSPALGGVAGILTMGCVLWPRSIGLRARLFGGNELTARKQGSKLKAREIVTPEINPPLPSDDEQNGDQIR